MEDLEIVINRIKEAGLDHDGNICQFLENPVLKNLVQIHDTLKDPLQHPTLTGFVAMCIEIATELKKNKEDVAAEELFSILTSPKIRSLMEAFESIAMETYCEDNFLPKTDTTNRGPPIRVVGLANNPKEPLGISLARHDDGCIYIQRIMRGTLVDRQGLFNVGDIIKEINGQPVGGDPDKVLQQMQSGGSEGVTVKCVPSFKDLRGTKCQLFYRCHFEYSPNEDKQFPKGETGLSFQSGDIVEILDQSDADWWQAKHVDQAHVGIIPSLRYEQTRKASNLISKKKQNKILGKFRNKGKRKIVYQTCNSSIFDCFDVRLYEEVVRMPAVESKVIALVGAQGLGKKSVVTRLISNYADCYVTVTPDTSREPREEEIQKKGYNFLDKGEMHQDILSGKYYEWGETNGQFYGSKLSSVRDIINSGKIALVDCDPSALKFLWTAEFMPFIVFLDSPDIDTLQKHNQQSNSKHATREELDKIIEESSEIKDTYHHYFDKTLTGGDAEKTYTELRQTLDAQANLTHQWVPVSWVY